MVSAICSGCGRLLSSQRVPRSTSRRECSRIRVWTSAATLLSSASTSSQIGAEPKIARAAVCARTISSVDAPVSSRSRCRKVVPPVLTVSLTSTVVTISRRSAWPSICSANRSRSGAREVRVQQPPQVRVVRQLGVDQLLGDRDLGVGEQHGQSPAGSGPGRR